MDTNLKKSKKVRAFGYRMIAAAALVTAIATAVMGREALVDAFYYKAEVFSGKYYELPEFKEYVGELYNKAMIGYAGIGDDMGYPLTDSYAKQYTEQAKKDFHWMVEAAGEDILYYVQKKDVGEQSNVSYPIFSEYDGHLLLPEDMLLCCYWDGENGNLTFFDEVGEANAPDRYYEAQYKPNKGEAADLKLVLAVRDCALYKFVPMERKALMYRDVMIFLTVSVAVWFVFGMLSLISGKAGRRAKEEYAVFSGKILVECKLLLVILSLFVLSHFRLNDFGMNLHDRVQICDSLWIYFPVGCLAYLLYTDVRKNTGKIFLCSLPVKCYSAIKDIFRRKPWYRRAKGFSIAMLIGGVMLIVGGIGFFSVEWSVRSFAEKWMKYIMTAGGAVLVPAGILLLYCYAKQSRLLKDMAAVVDKLSEVAGGQTGVPLKLSKDSLLETTASNLNELETGIEKAVEVQNRSNKMKVELLTNVSHDLKTPLTSIINYADLLCEEELPGSAAEYAAALREKSYRLKNMVQDVFDLSKATSGNLHVECTVIDLVKLIKQTLADMDERIQESNLTFKLNISTEPLMIEADGEKLYRIFQNLFVNALQYSLDHSRVHIQLVEEEGYAVAKVKNTSRMELDFEPSEIVERFVRADSSRTTEGSGLGLSIVQSFAEACGGQFMVETDADMFTASVRFPLRQGTAGTESKEETEAELLNSLNYGHVR